MQREVIVLFEIDGYTIEEVADMQRASIPAVKSRLSRRRRKLRRFYERRGWGPSAPADPAAAGEVTGRNREGGARQTKAVPLLATAPGFESMKERSHE